MDKLELTDAKELTNQEKEVYRTLRTNLEFTGVENRVIAVTSCGPDEGKSTVSYNLDVLWLPPEGQRYILMRI